MKTVKPMSLGLLYRTFEREHRFFFVVTVFGYFSFERSGYLHAEADMWKEVGETLGAEGILDEGMPKPEREILVYGNAYPHSGKPEPVCKVRMQCASVDKTLYAIGDRFWRADGVASDPIPFENMPLRWENAFGGDGFAANPRGKGFAAIDERHPLPNLEDPRSLVKRRGDRPEPVCFGGYDPGWPQRTRFAGTYDERWLEELSPGWPLDFDLHYYCVAAPDQRLATIASDEAFTIEGMHASKARLEGRIPAVRARCFVRRSRVETLDELSLALDTVHLFPNVERGVVVFRGVTEVFEDDADDIEHLLIAAEDVGTSRPASHYARSLEERLDPEHGALRSLREDDLLPQRMASERPIEVQGGGLIAQRMRRRAELELERVRAELEKQGIDPDAHGVPRELPPPEPVPSLAELPEYLDKQRARIEELRKEADAQRKAAEDRARELCRDAGVDYDAAVGKSDNSGPPAFRAEAELQRIRNQLELAENAGVPLPHLEAQLPELPERLRRVEQQLLEVYRRFAHYQEPVPELSSETAQDRKQQLLEAVRRGESLRDRDLTGADLRGVQLAQANLQGALLESANLEGADLRGADLSDAVLTRANLEKAVLAKASLRGANLGSARLRGAVLDDAQLDGAVLMKADLSEAKLARARLNDADVTETVLNGADLSESVAPSLMFRGTRLDGAKLARAIVNETLWLEVAADALDMSGADLRGATFVSVDLPRANLGAAKLQNARFVGGSKLRDARLQGADLERACLRECDLTNADLSGARLVQADLGKCKADGASFYRAEADGALFVRASLRGARMVSLRAIQGLFGNADLRDADLSGANLFRTDLMRVRLSRKTKIDDALIQQSRFRERARSEGNARDEG